MIVWRVTVTFDDADNNFDFFEEYFNTYEEAKEYSSSYRTGKDLLNSDGESIGVISTVEIEEIERTDIL